MILAYVAAAVVAFLAVGLAAWLERAVERIEREDTPWR